MNNESDKYRKWPVLLNGARIGLLLAMVYLASCSSQSAKESIESRIEIGRYADKGQRLTREEAENIYRLDGRELPDSIYALRRANFISGHTQDLTPYKVQAERFKRSCHQSVSAEYQHRLASCFDTVRDKKEYAGSDPVVQCESELSRAAARACSNVTHDTQLYTSKPLSIPEVACDWDVDNIAFWQFIRERAVDNIYYLPRISYGSYFGLSSYVANACETASSAVVTSSMVDINNAAQATKLEVANDIKQAEQFQSDSASSRLVAFAEVVPSDNQRVLWGSDTIHHSLNNVPFESRKEGSAAAVYGIEKNVLSELQATTPEPKVIKNEFETDVQFQSRRASLLKEHAEAIATEKEKAKNKLSEIISMAMNNSLGDPTLEQFAYNADQEQFNLVVVSKPTGYSLKGAIDVPRDLAPDFKETFSSAKPYVVLKNVNGVVNIAGIVLEKDGKFKAIQVPPTPETELLISNSAVAKYERELEERRMANFQKEVDINQARRAQADSELKDNFPNSPKMLSDVLCRNLGLSLIRIKRSGGPSNESIRDMQAQRIIKTYTSKGIYCF